jgi:hypothetical protein
LDDDRRIERARAFDTVAQLYDRSRRAYPEEFFRRSLCARRNHNQLLSTNDGGATWTDITPR